MKTEKAKIENLRKQIDQVDEKIIRLLKERLDLSSQIGKRKSEINDSIENPQREKDIYNKLKNYCKEYNLNEPVINKIWQIIIIESYKKQKDSGNDLN